MNAELCIHLYIIRNKYLCNICISETNHKNIYDDTILDIRKNYTTIKTTNIIQHENQNITHSTLTHISHTLE